MVNSIAIRKGLELSLKKKDSDEYVKLGFIRNIHRVETGFILETDEGRMLKVKTKNLAPPKDPDIHVDPAKPGGDKTAIKVMST